MYVQYNKLYIKLYNKNILTNKSILFGNMFYFI